MCVLLETEIRRRPATGDGRLYALDMLSDICYKSKKISEQNGIIDKYRKLPELQSSIIISIKSSHKQEQFSAMGFGEVDKKGVV